MSPISTPPLGGPKNIILIHTPDFGLADTGRAQLPTLELARLLGAGDPIYKMAVETKSRRPKHGEVDDDLLAFC